MKRALISDIHGNLEALEAVLEDIRQVSVDEIYCLGDIIGYGPNPCECLDLVIKNCKSTILGNHDQAALFDPDGFAGDLLDSGSAGQWPRFGRHGESAVGLFGRIAASAGRRDVPFRSWITTRLDQRIRVSRVRV